MITPDLKDPITIGIKLEVQYGIIFKGIFGGNQNTPQIMPWNANQPLCLTEYMYFWEKNKHMPYVCFKFQGSLGQKEEKDWKWKLT